MQLIYFAVVTVLLYELLMRAGFCDHAVLQYDYPVRCPCGGYSLRNYYLSTRKIQRGKRVLDMLFGFEIDSRGRIVKYQYRRLYRQRSRQRDTLLLSAGKSDSALADYRVIAVGSLFDKVVRIGSLCVFNDIILGKINIAEADIALYGVGIQQHVLCGDTYRAAELFQFHHSHIMTVNKHRAGGHVIYSRDKVDKGGLAGSGGTHDRDGLTRFRLEADILQYLCIAVGERHVLKLNTALYASFYLLRVLAVCNERSAVVELNDLVRRSGKSLIVVDDVSESPHGV